MHIRDVLNLVSFGETTITIGNQVVEGFPEEFVIMFYSWWNEAIKAASRMVHPLTWLDAPMQANATNIDYFAYLMGQNNGQLAQIPAPNSPIKPLEAMDLTRMAGILQGLLMGGGHDPDTMQSILQQKIEQTLRKQKTTLIIPGPSEVRKFGK